MLFCCLWIFFLIFSKKKKISGIPSKYQTFWLQIRPDILLGLIWVQTVCKGNQQTTKVATSGERVNMYQIQRERKTCINEKKAPNPECFKARTFLGKANYGRTNHVKFFADGSPTHLFNVNLQALTYLIIMVFIIMVFQ